jgi:hypothetical protein
MIQLLGDHVDTAKYLGVAISSNMTLNAYINNVTSKAQKLFGFLRRNLQIKSEQTKTTAYTSWQPYCVLFCTA